MKLLPGQLTRGCSWPYFPVQTNQSFELVKFSIFVDVGSRHDRSHLIRLSKNDMVFLVELPDGGAGDKIAVVSGISDLAACVADGFTSRTKNRKFGWVQTSRISHVVQRTGGTHGRIAGVLESTTVCHSV